jgi:L-lactate dehydrogenase complex protein LldG
MSRRDEILGRIRTSLGAETHDVTRRRTAEQRISAPARHMLPQRNEKAADDLRQQFAAYLKGQAAEVHDIATPGDVPRAVFGVLRRLNLPARIRMGSDPYLAAMPWTSEPGLVIAHGPSDGSDQVTLSHALAGVAETGTLALLSGPDNPVTLSFLPETHIVVVEGRSIVGPYEAVFDLMRERLGRQVMPRTLNFISGASRTADIGGKIVIGAHGPRRLVVLVVG